MLLPALIKRQCIVAAYTSPVISVLAATPVFMLSGSPAGQYPETILFFTLLFLVFQLALLLLQFNLARSREFCPDFSELFELVADKAIFGGAK